MRKFRDRIVCLCLSAVFAILAVLAWGGPDRHAMRLATLGQARDTEAAEVEALFHTYVGLERFIASLMATMGGSDELAPAVHALLRSTPGLDGIEVVDPRGRVLFESRSRAVSDAGSGDRARLVIEADPIAPIIGISVGLGGSILLRSSEAAKTAGVVGLGLDFMNPVSGLRNRITVYAQGRNLPAIDAAIAPSWLIGDDGAVLAAPGAGSHKPDIAARIAHLSHQWQGLGSAAAQAGSVTLRMADGDHLLLYRRLLSWPATVMLDAGLVKTDWPGEGDTVALVQVVVMLGFAVRATRPCVARAAMPAATTASGRRGLADVTVHELNNLLTVLSFDAGMVALGHPDDPQSVLLSRSMRDAVRRCSVLVSDLLSPSRDDEPPPDPIAESPPDPVQQSVSAAPPVSARRVLLVDDNALVRQSIARRLRADGYTVVEAGGAGEALPLVSGIDLLVTDIVLGDQVDGWALAAQARLQDPMLPLVFMSGFMSARQPDVLVRDELASFLRKPVQGGELHTVIEGLLAVRDGNRLQKPVEPPSLA